MENFRRTWYENFEAVLLNRKYTYNLTIFAGTKLDIGHYNALLHVYLENDYDFSPSDVLDDLKRKVIKPNRVTLQLLIRRYGQMGDVESAARIYQQLRDQNAPINTYVFNSLILSHVQKGYAFLSIFGFSYYNFSHIILVDSDVQSAEKMLDEMKNNGCEPNSETLTLLMQGFIKLGDLKKYRKLLDKCEEESELGNENYLEIIHTLAKCNQMEEVDEVIVMNLEYKGWVLSSETSPITSLERRESKK